MRQERRTITDLFFVVSPNLDELEKGIKTALDDGYELYGEVSVEPNSDKFATMVKFAKRRRIENEPQYRGIHIDGGINDNDKST